MFGSCFFVGEKYRKLKEVLFDIICKQIQDRFLANQNVSPIPLPPSPFTRKRIRHQRMNRRHHKSRIYKKGEKLRTTVDINYVLVWSKSCFSYIQYKGKACVFWYINKMSNSFHMRVLIPTYGTVDVILAFRSYLHSVKIILLLQLYYIMYVIQSNK